MAAKGLILYSISCSKIRPAEVVNSLNVEHRTSNIERRILMTLRFIDFITNGSQNPPAKQAYAVFFFKLTEYLIRCWTFNVRCSTFISFFSDQTGRFLARGVAYMKGTSYPKLFKYANEFLFSYHFRNSLY